MPHEIMGFFAHVQTVDTRPLFPPPTWPEYEANLCTTWFAISSENTAEQAPH